MTTILQYLPWVAILVVVILIAVFGVSNETKQLRAYVTGIMTGVLMFIGAMGLTLTISDARLKIVNVREVPQEENFLTFKNGRYLCRAQD